MLPGMKREARLRMRYVLMCKDREVLEFDIAFPSCALGDIRPLEGIALAPLGVSASNGLHEGALWQFICDRSISEFRADLPAILQATGTRNPVELAFKSGGFSLSDPYWYRAQDTRLTWAHDNFFHNEWDPAFGDAVLQSDYRALETASLATPDATCSGSSRKAWIRDERGPRLLKANAIERGASMVAEALASCMLARLLPESEFVSYELVERNGETYSASRPIVNSDEALSMAWQVVAANNQATADEQAATSLLGTDLLKELMSVFSRMGIEGSGQFMAKAEVIAHLTFYRDMHPHNMGVIRTVDSGAMRLAPFFDFDRAFGLSKRDRMDEACARPQIAALMMAKTFSNLDPSWDYSWYDPCALDGFEHEITRTLSSSNAIPQGFVELVADLFVAQRTYVNRIATNG